MKENKIAEAINNTLKFSQTLPKDFKKYETYCLNCGVLLRTPFIARVKKLNKEKIPKLSQEEIQNWYKSKKCWKCYNKKEVTE